MASQGSPHTRFQRALAARNALADWAAAHELAQVSLENALALVLLLADSDPDRFELAAVRWHACVCRELRGLTLDESAVALAALRALPGRAGIAAGRSLAAICELRGLDRAVEGLEDGLERRRGDESAV